MPTSKKRSGWIASNLASEVPVGIAAVMATIRRSSSASSITVRAKTSWYLGGAGGAPGIGGGGAGGGEEKHTPEIPAHPNLVYRPLLLKKKNQRRLSHHSIIS